MRFFIFLSIAFLPVATVFAESESDSVKYRFDPVVVTATKIAGAQKELASSVTVIDQQTIRRAATHSAMDLVTSYVPGVYITQKSIMGYGVASAAAGEISIRGIGGSPVTGVLVLRDGRPDIMGMMGHPIPDAYTLDGVERIEVVRGPASFLYGTNAMGGVINIVSQKRQQNGFTTRVIGGMGNYQTKKLLGSHGGKIDNFNYNLTAANRQTDGHRPNADYEGDTYTAHLGYELNHNTKISLNANLSNIYLKDPGPDTLTTTPTDQWYDLRRSGADLTLSHAHKYGESYLRVHGNWGRHKIFDGWRSNDHTIGVMLYHNTSFWRGHSATVGFDYKQYGGDARDSVIQYPWIQYGAQSITEFAPYIHMQQLLYNRFILSAGLRTENHQLYGNEWIPKIGLVTHLNKNFSVRFSAAKGFRSPAIRELYVFPPRNENLQPERLWNYEIGISQHLGSWGIFDAALFRSKGSNMIRIVGVPPAMQFTNSGDFVHSGYELSLQMAPTRHFQVASTWTKLDLQNETRETPGKKLTLTFSYQWPRLSLQANAIHIMDLYAMDNHKMPLDDYTVVDLKSTFKLVRFVDLAVSLKNLLDVEYEIKPFYPMPGRTFMMELLFKYR
ncbi:TonB-dependent receptor [candidate division KSB1 bacterium]|nr:TonB-dependent receptor [candidate division KSB1 bacterium]